MKDLWFSGLAVAGYMLLGTVAFFMRILRREKPLPLRRINPKNGSSILG